MCAMGVWDVVCEGCSKMDKEDAGNVKCGMLSV